MPRNSSRAYQRMQPPPASAWQAGRISTPNSARPHSFFPLVGPHGRPECRGAVQASLLGQGRAAAHRRAQGVRWGTGAMWPQPTTDPGVLSFHQ